MDNYEETNIVEEIIPIKKIKYSKNKTKKRIDKEIECKNIKTEENCLTRTDCLLNKSGKCQKKKTKVAVFLEESKDRISQDKISEEDNPSQQIDKIIVSDKSTCQQQIKVLRDELARIRKNYDDKIRECEEIEFGEFVTKYFNKGEDKLTHKDLLVGLQKYYIDEKTQNINFILSMQEFIQKFSQKTPVSGSNYKRQHIFEALCRLLIFF